MRCWSPASRNLYGVLPGKSHLDRLSCRAFLVCSPMASRSHWPTLIMTWKTRRPAAEPVSSNSAADTKGIPFRRKNSRRAARSRTGCVSRSIFATIHFTSLNELEGLFHSRPLEVLGALTGIDGQIGELRLRRGLPRKVFFGGSPQVKIAFGRPPVGRHFLSFPALPLFSGCRPPSSWDLLITDSLP